MSGPPRAAGGPPVLHPSVFLAAGAVVVGDVRIGARSSVWFNTVLRGDTDGIEVGEDSNLQDLTLVHVDEGSPARIGNRVTVGHRVILHGCTIEDDCLVGMGAIVLSRAVVGAGSLIGAGALVLEGQQIPAGSVVLGAPAKVVGPVKPEHREAIARGTEHYVELARSHAAGRFPAAARGPEDR
jgi:carbonic anhydrase/acetyltransferase-like protein (isoleucine patch superfamily)